MALDMNTQTDMGSQQLCDGNTRNGEPTTSSHLSTSEDEDNGVIRTNSDKREKVINRSLWWCNRHECTKTASGDCWLWLWLLLLLSPALNGRLRPTLGHDARYTMFACVLRITMWSDKIETHFKIVSQRPLELDKDP